MIADPRSSTRWRRSRPPGGNRRPAARRTASVVVGAELSGRARAGGPGRRAVGRGGGQCAATRAGQLAVQLTAGALLLPFHEPRNPKDVLAPAPSRPLCDTFRAITLAPLLVMVAFQTWLTV